MRALSNIFRNPSLYISTCYENSRLIERERHILRDDKIVLLNDFAAAAVSQPIDSDSKTEIQRHIERFYSSLRTMFELQTIVYPEKGFFRLPRSLASEESLENDQRLKPLEKEILENFQSRVSLSLLILVSEKRKREMMQEYQNIQYKEEPYNFLAMYLGPLMRSSELDDEKLENYKAWSILSGDAGKSVLSFYKAVNSLNDYSGSFPDRPRMPPGPPGRKKETRSSARKNWLPGLAPQGA